MYSLEEMSFGYQEAIFENVTIQINENKIGLIGENGIGKTTLLKLFNGELKPGKGNISVDAKTYRVNFDLEKYKKFTISDLIEIAKKMQAFDCSNVEKYLKILNVEKYANTEIGKLSKGTAKKASLLLGFLTKDRVLLLDEPFESLDEKTNSNLVKLFYESEKKMIIVSHDYDLLDKSVDAIYEVTDRTLRAR